MQRPLGGNGPGSCAKQDEGEDAGAQGATGREAQGEGSLAGARPSEASRLRQEFGFCAQGSLGRLVEQRWENDTDGENIGLLGELRFFSSWASN